MFTPVYYFTNKTCPCSSSITSLFLSSLFSLLKTHLFDTDNTDLTCLTSTHQYCVASFKISHIKKIIKIINTFPMTKSEGGWGSHCNHSRLQYVLNASVCWWREWACVSSKMNYFCFMWPIWPNWYESFTFKWADKKNTLWDLRAHRLDWGTENRDLRWPLFDLSNNNNKNNNDRNSLLCLMLCLILECPALAHICTQQS